MVDFRLLKYVKYACFPRSIIHMLHVSDDVTHVKGNPTNTYFAHAEIGVALACFLTNNYIYSTYPSNYSNAMV